MQQWKFFVLMDERHDWIAKNGVMPQIEEKDEPGFGWVRSAIADFGPPTRAECEEWNRNVYAMRIRLRAALSVTRLRANFYANDPPLIDGLEADRVVAGHVSKMTLLIRLGPKPLRSLDRFILAPRNPEGPNSTFSGGIVEVMWQVIFGSMLPGLGVPVCCDCRARRAQSPNPGRTSKAVRCKKCSYANWLNGYTIKKSGGRIRKEQKAASTGGEEITIHKSEGGVIMPRKARGRGEGCIGQQGSRWFAYAVWL